MEKINFVNGQSPYISATNLNNLQDNVENAINGIIESGSNANGKYIKFSDGTLICYGRAIMSFSINIAYGSVFRSDIQSISLPYSFIDTNYVVTLQGIAPVHVCYAVDDDKSVNLFKFYPVGFVSQASVSSRNIGYMCIGKWK